MFGSMSLASALTQRLSQVALNPQPLPPRDSNSALGDSVALNPQPLPPKAGFGSLADRVSLNPQPLPPKALSSSLGDRVSLNPQPLPPRDLLSAFSRAFAGVSGPGAAGAADAPASDRGIIVVGGRSFMPSAINQRGIIIVGG